MKKYRGIIKINGKKYNVEIIDGERFVEGKTIDEFLDGLPWRDLYDLAIGGGIVFADIINGEEGKRSPQKIMNELYQERNN